VSRALIRAYHLAALNGTLIKKMKTFLITGGSGFIGAHLCKRILQKNKEEGEKNKVICVDNFITGDKNNIFTLFDNPNFEFIEHDVSNYIDIKQKIDYVLHFASLASPKDYTKYPIKTLKVGAIGTYNCLGLAKDKKAKFILASTSEVYGDPEVHPQKENYWGHVNPVGPRGCYDESKRFAESLAIAYQNTHGINVKIIRIFNTYGPMMRRHDGRVIPNFIIQALFGKPLTIYGDGSQTRSFCYIDDLVKGIVKLIDVEKSFIVNLGNPQEIKILKLAEEILKISSSKSDIKFCDIPQDEPRRRQPDISKAKELICFKPEVSLQQGLLNTINWFKRN